MGCLTFFFFLGYWKCLWMQSITGFWFLHSGQGIWESLVRQQVCCFSFCIIIIILQFASRKLHFKCCYDPEHDVYISGWEQKLEAVCVWAQSCLTLCDSMDCSLPEASVRGIFQARILEWVAIPFSRGSSWPRDWTRVSCVSSITGTWILHHSTTWEGASSRLSPFFSGDWT